MKKLKYLSPDEDHAINTAIAQDPDTWEETDSRKAKRGRPFADVTKTSISLRLDPDVLEYFRATGRGWQTRINSILREAMEAR